MIPTRSHFVQSKIGAQKIKSKTTFQSFILVISIAATLFVVGLVGFALAPVQADALAEILGKDDAETLGKITPFLVESNFKLAITLVLPHIAVIVLILKSKANRMESKKGSETKKGSQIID